LGVGRGRVGMHMVNFSLTQMRENGKPCGQPAKATMERDHQVYVAATPLRATKRPA